MKTECEQIKNRLSAYLDGEVNSAEKLRIEQHISECGECRELLEEFIQGWDLLGETLMQTPQVDVVAARREFWSKADAGKGKLTISDIRMFKFLKKLAIIMTFLAAIPLGYALGEKLISKSADTQTGAEIEQTEYFFNNISSNFSEEIALTVLDYSSDEKTETSVKTEERGAMQQ